VIGLKSDNSCQWNRPI